MLVLFQLNLFNFYQTKFAQISIVTTHNYKKNAIVTGSNWETPSRKRRREVSKNLYQENLHNALNTGRKHETRNIFNVLGEDNKTNGAESNIPTAISKPLYITICKEGYIEILFWESCTDPVRMNPKCLGNPAVSTSLTQPLIYATLYNPVVGIHIAITASVRVLK